MSKHETRWIAPYPYSSNIEVVDGEWKPKLSILSRMSVDAAFSTWQGPNQKLEIVLAGETLYGPHLPNTTDLMVDRIKELAGSDDVPIIDLHRLPGGTPLNNTYRQTEALAHFLWARSAKPYDMDISTLHYHAPRVIMANQAYDLRTQNSIAEARLAEDGVDEYEKYYDTIDGLKKSEKIARLISAVNPRGGLLNYVSDLQGGRLVDVVEGDEDIVLVNTTAKKNAARLASKHGIKPIQYK